MFNRKYESKIRVANPMHGSPTLVIWIVRPIWELHHAIGTLDDSNVVALSIPPNTIAWSYEKIKSYGNHFCVNDSSTISTMTYNSGMATFFSHSNDDGNQHSSRQLHYVGVLKEILELDYGVVSTPIILFRCDWVRNGLDNRDNPTYKWDEAHVAER
jgi:hypothetical protein